MKLRPHRRTLVIWSSSATPVGQLGCAPHTRPAPARRLRRSLHISTVLTVAGLMRLARGAGPRGRLVLAGAVLTAVGIATRGEPAGLVLVPGLLLIFSAPLAPALAQADRKAARDLRGQLAAYSTPAQRRDLGATLDQYPDEDTSELRAFLAGQADISSRRLRA